MPYFRRNSDDGRRSSLWGATPKIVLLALILAYVFKACQPGYVLVTYYHINGDRVIRIANGYVETRLEGTTVIILYWATILAVIAFVGSIVSLVLILAQIRHSRLSESNDFLDSYNFYRSTRSSRSSRSSRSLSSRSSRSSRRDSRESPSHERPAVAEDVIGWFQMTNKIRLESEYPAYVPWKPYKLPDGSTPNSDDPERKDWCAVCLRCQCVECQKMCDTPRPAKSESRKSIWMTMVTAIFCCKWSKCCGSKDKKREQDDGATDAADIEVDRPVEEETPAKRSCILGCLPCARQNSLACCSAGWSSRKCPDNCFGNVNVKNCLCVNWETFKRDRRHIAATAQGSFHMTSSRRRRCLRGLSPAKAARNSNARAAAVAAATAAIDAATAAMDASKAAAAAAAMDASKAAAAAAATAAAANLDANGTAAAAANLDANGTAAAAANLVANDTAAAAAANPVANETAAAAPAVETMVMTHAKADASRLLANTRTVVVDVHKSSTIRYMNAIHRSPRTSSSDSSSSSQQDDNEDNQYL